MNQETEDGEIISSTRISFIFWQKMQDNYSTAYSGYVKTDIKATKAYRQYQEQPTDENLFIYEQARHLSDSAGAIADTAHKDLESAYTNVLLSREKKRQPPGLVGL